MLGNLLNSIYQRVHPGDGLVWDKPAKIFYGTPLDSTQLNASAPSSHTAGGGTFAYDPPPGSVLPAGEHLLKVTFTPADLKTNKRARILKMQHKLSVEKATPHLAWKSPAPIYFGTQLSRKQLNAACVDLPGGDYVYNPPLRAVVPVGTHTLTVTYEPEDTIKCNYHPASLTVEIVIIPLRQPVFKWIDPAPIVFGTKLGPDQLNAVLPGYADRGVIVYEPAAGFLLNAGDAQQLKVTFTPNNKVEVASAEARVTIRVDKHESLLVWSDLTNLYVGTPLGKGQLSTTCSNLPGGSFKYSHRLDQVLAEGTHEITVEYAPDRKFIKNFLPATLSRTLVIMPLHQPVFSWTDPKPFVYLNPLSPRELCAQLCFPLHGFAPEFEYSSTADPAFSDHGKITYEPQLGTVPNATRDGRPLVLTVTFEPYNTSQVLPAKASVTLIVLRADPVIEWKDPEPVLMHTLLSQVQLNAVCTLPRASDGGPDGQLVYAPPLGTHLPVGVHTLAVTYLPSKHHSRNFNSITSTVEISIEQPEPLMKWADPPPVHVGRPLTKKHLNAICVEPGIPPGTGTFAYDPPFGAIMPQGLRQKLRLTYTVAPEYQYSYQPAQLSVLIDVVPPRIPQITWDPPAAIPFGAPLTQLQLNAKCNVSEGFLYYDPPRGTILASGETHTLTVSFVPDDHLEWQAVSLTVPIFICKTDPVLVWTPQRYFFAGMPLGIEHLCCEVKQGSTFIEGKFTYKPQLGAVLGAGTHTLTAFFKCHKKHRQEWNDVSMTVELVVSPKIFPEIQWNHPEPIVYGQRLSAMQLCAVCKVTQGILTYDPPLGTLLDAGESRLLTVTFHPVNTIEYNPSTATVSLLVRKAVPPLTWEPPPFLYIGAPLANKHLNAYVNESAMLVHQSLPGTWVYCPELGEVLPLGKHTMTAIFKPDDSISSNWTFASSFCTMLVITEGSLFKMPQRYLEPETRREFPVDDREFLLEPDKLAHFSSGIDCFPPEPVRKVVEKMKSSEMLKKAKLQRGELDISYSLSRPSALSLEQAMDMGKSMRVGVGVGVGVGKEQTNGEIPAVDSADEDEA